MKIAVVGTGYVGLVAGTCFADFGNQVTCLDVDATRISKLNDGIIPIYEPGLTDLVVRNHKRGRLQFTTNVREALTDADCIFIAVGTPQDQDGRADLQYVLAAARDIGKHLTKFAVIATKSTVPVGTADKVRAAVAEHAKVEFAVASNPEFLKEGDAVNDFMKPARVIVGVDSPRAQEVLETLYRPFVRSRNRLHVVDIRSAELIKYAANAMLATRISFMNELALLAERVGADIEKVRLGIGSDPRIGPSFLYAGPGFGGSCFPKDLEALVHTGQAVGEPMAIIDAVKKVNARQKKLLGQKVRAHFGGTLANKRIAVWGLAFKPETDDIREAPALVLIDDLLAAGADVVAYDPEAISNVKAQHPELAGRVTFASDALSATDGADALVLVTEWHEFREPDFAMIKTRLRTPVLFDGRNIWNGPSLLKSGFAYVGIGRHAGAV